MPGDDLKRYPRLGILSFDASNGIPSMSEYYTAYTGTLYFTASEGDAGAPPLNAN